MPQDEGQAHASAGENVMHKVSIISMGNADPDSNLATLRCHKTEMKLCRRSLFIFAIDKQPRKAILSLVQWKWFDRLILLCIFLNSLCLATYQYRPSPGAHHFNDINNIVSNILTGVFTFECVIKIISWGFIMDYGTYLRGKGPCDWWNLLDFIVVISGIIEWIPFIDVGGLGFLRLFRVLRPLRSLNSIPKMAVIVETTLKSIPRLFWVTTMGVFIFAVFAIIGITLMPGIFYHRCRESENPVWCSGCQPTGCWEWNYTTTESAERLCGGRYNCLQDEFCRGHHEDPDDKFRPQFSDDGPSIKNNGKWCPGSEPTKFNMDGAAISGWPETQFVHFDHMGGAFLLVFQCMTMEGWTDLMYYVQDGCDTWIARIYFILVIIMASFFLLNVALAVVDEARDDFEDGKEAEEEEEKEGGEGKDEDDEDAGGQGPAKEEDSDEQQEDEKDEEDWWDNPIVRVSKTITQNDAFSNFVLLIIMGNVVLMMMEKFPPDVGSEPAKFICNIVFMVIFLIEMALEHIARGPIGYWKNLTTGFDGFVVIISIIEMVTGGKGGLKALRTLRLFRVLNKLAKRNPDLAVLLKAMIGTGYSLGYWLVLFFLAIFIFTLMLMSFFANNFHFQEEDLPPGTFAKSITLPGQIGPDNAWCPGTTYADRFTREDCVPRAHFDTFLWGFVTVYQIMTGENWNTIMYAGMRSGGWVASFLFIFLILFGQILILNLFLSMLISKFSDLQQDYKQTHMERQPSMNRTSTNTLAYGNRVVPWDHSESKDSTPKDKPGSPSAAFCDAMPPGPKSTGEIKKGWEEGDGARPRPKQQDFGPWPRGYSWFLMTTQNPIRKFALKLLTLDLAGNDESVRREANEQMRIEYFTKKTSTEEQGMKPKMTGPPKLPSLPSSQLIFDNFILICILLSTIMMMIDGPLADEQESVVIAVVRKADTVFAIIFITEMAIKLLAYPLVWGNNDPPLTPEELKKHNGCCERCAQGKYHNSYLWSPGCGWNWLDAVVVLVSVIGFTGDGPSFLKTLRILRAFRPLRVINRNRNLKLVVETVFKSMQALGWLLVVFMLFLLIFALMFLMFLGGSMNACDGEGVGYLRSTGPDFAAPLCLAGTFALQRDAVISGIAVAAGSWNQQDLQWTSTACGTGQTIWQRVSADTPICVGACDPFDGHDRPSFCPRRYNQTEELPSMCDGVSYSAGDPGFVGQTFVEEMQHTYTIPCGGSTAASANTAGADPPKAAASCKEAFCPAGSARAPSADKVESCRSDCEQHPYFCANTCQDCISSGICTGECKSCRLECEAACQCEQYCTPQIKDAALCYEQGSRWAQVVSQNFNNIINAMLTLLEISTTEGWVDVMYAACDSVGPYMQPLRDNNHIVYIPLFSIWIFLSFMFLLNLGVGVIVDKFMEMREKGQELLLTKRQQAWKKSRLQLYGASQVFNLENLHLLEQPRRKVYDFVEGPYFDNVIMACIVLNTLVMAMKVFPEPIAAWDSTLAIVNYAFAVIYTIEAGLKLFAYRSSYFSSKWNCFDLFCVMATFVGIFLKFAMTGGPNIAPIMSVLRIFRIARILRLLRFLVQLNRLFMALFLCLPKLVNVVGILVLFLVLFSILGVQLFATTKLSETLNIHGNFQSFDRAFVTLFRASTGEAWNEIMHDLGKTEVDFFRDGDWCAPAELYDTQDKFEELKTKCLIQTPNSCVQTFFGSNFVPYAYWVMYTLFIGMVVMNLVISVILDGYEEAKKGDPVTIQICRDLWASKYDPDHKMTIPLKDAVRFICEAVERTTDGEVKLPAEIHKLPMKYAKAFDLAVDRSMKKEVHFKTATRQVIRFIAVHEGPDEEKDEENRKKGFKKMDILEVIDESDEKLDVKERKRLKDLENRTPGGMNGLINTSNMKDMDVSEEGDRWTRPEEPFCAQIAATKMQKMVRDRKVWQNRSYQAKDAVPPKEPEVEIRPAVAG